jgi:hypothetical protein
MSEPLFELEQRDPSQPVFVTEYGVSLEMGRVVVCTDSLEAWDMSQREPGSTVLQRQLLVGPWSEAVA